MTAPDRMPEAFENSLHDAGHPHMEPPANPGRFRQSKPRRATVGVLSRSKISTPYSAPQGERATNLAKPSVGYSTQCKEYLIWVASERQN